MDLVPDEPAARGVLEHSASTAQPKPLFNIKDQFFQDVLALVPLVFLAGSVVAIELISLSYLLLGQWFEKLFGWKSLLQRLYAGSGARLLAPAPTSQTPPVSQRLSGARSQGGPTRAESRS